ncbi:peptide/nickel transport system ATP-binding protein/peptide/nickel transport system ATP-binding protein [Ruegeria intermedia]|uniref:Peptide/nickel transport system ATP-binding protein/peptide/nickel transport system ATP-binding protein n=1 Tax=Ruegeria intermedia TaxID=996115 RepID=A0A1M5BM75_9RHOB|nr:ATP-binding cassette domain-containing protein [Ruegeria intermedia]SHF43614.1 peptide/nickel transport system ATP-binding protein/peptide/nickel transport system ATP-binding protein [Ruegeria intermedia]
MTLNVTGLSAVRSGRTILHPTTLEIPPRSRIGLVGASGSGKSTLGHVLIDDLRARGYNVAHVPQSPDEALDPLRSMAFHWREAEMALGLATGSTDRVGLFRALKIEGGDMRKRPWGWSRGMQQRFVIAMALIGAPDLIVLDEPTSALDPVVAATTMDLLSVTLKDRNTAMLLITHDLGLAARRVDTLMVMDEGRLVERGRTEDILENPQTRAAKSLSAHRSWLALPC